MRSCALSYFFLLLVGCNQGSDQNPGSIKTNYRMREYSPVFSKAHPNARALMKEEFYFSPGDETGPFGNDDAADTYAGFSEWRVSHPKDDPADYLYDQLNEWGYPRFDIYETDINKLRPYLEESDLSIRYLTGIDAAIIAIAFGQFYLEGTIYKSFKPTAIIALYRQLNPEILAHWPKSYRPERERKLNKMLAVLNQVK